MLTEDIHSNYNKNIIISQGFLMAEDQNKVGPLEDCAGNIIQGIKT